MSLSDDLFDFLYIALQSSSNLTGSNSVFTENFELDKGLTIVITCTSTCTKHKFNF